MRPFENLADLLCTYGKIRSSRFYLTKGILDGGVAGGLLLLVLWWLLPLLMLLVWLDLGHPVFFIQERIGKNNRCFRCYKLRTMRETPSELSRLGAFLRHTKLDEIPQFFNVLRGEMSVIGPRPHMLADHVAFSRLVGPGYHYRHLVKPGITGLAQVNGYEGPVTSPQVLEGRIFHDLSYIQNWTLASEIRILWKTHCLILRGFLRRPGLPREERSLLRNS